MLSPIGILAVVTAFGFVLVWVLIRYFILALHTAPTFHDLVGANKPASVSNLQMASIGYFGSSEYLHCNIAPGDIQTVIGANPTCVIVGTFASSQLNLSFPGKPAWWKLKSSNSTWTEYSSEDVKPTTHRNLFVSSNKTEIYVYCEVSDD